MLSRIKQAQAGGAVGTSTQKRDVTPSIGPVESRRTATTRKVNYRDQSYEDRTHLEAQEDMNPASKAQAPYSVDDTGQGVWVVLTVALIFLAYHLADQMIWNAAQRAQEVQPW